VTPTPSYYSPVSHGRRPSAPPAVVNEGHPGYFDFGIVRVEVQNGAKLIWQARRKCNMLAGEKHRGILRRWAGQAALQLAKHV
jgi:hypothetical protein